MGQSASELEQKQTEHDEETIEQLQILEKMVSAKIQAASEKMALQARKDSQLPILAIVDKVEKFMLKVENKPGDVEKAIDDLFDGKFLKALKDAIVIAVNELLGNTVAGEQQVTDFHIAYSNNTFIRVDYFVYHYVFTSKGLQNKYKNALGYTIQVGVLNIEKLNPQVAFYEVSKCIGPENLKDEVLRLKDDATFLEDMYNNTKKIEKIFKNDSEVENPTERTQEGGVEILKKFQDITSKLANIFTKEKASEPEIEKPTERTQEEGINSEILSTFQDVRPKRAVRRVVSWFLTRRLREQSKSSQ